MSKEQSHELQEQQQCQLPHDESEQQQLDHQRQPANSELSGQGTTASARPPSAEQVRPLTAGRRSVSLMSGRAAYTVTPLNQLSNAPQWIDCPFCKQRTRTTVKMVGGNMQIIVGAVLCLFCVCLTCLPCLLHWFEDTDWHCSRCQRKVATRKNEGAVQVLGPPRVVYSQYGSGGSMDKPKQQQPQKPEASQPQNGDVQSPPLQTPAHPPVDSKK